MEAKTYHPKLAPDADFMTHMLSQLMQISVEKHSYGTFIATATVVHDLRCGMGLFAFATPADMMVDQATNVSFWRAALWDWVEKYPDRADRFTATAFAIRKEQQLQDGGPA